MPQIDPQSAIDALKAFSAQDKKKLRIILLGGLALHYYGMENRSTIDLDAEIEGDLEGVFNFLKSKKIPSDLSENISGWSVVAMPHGYRDRVSRVFQSEYLEVDILAPTDFVISKIRRFSEEDIEDALFVVKKYDLKKEDIAQAAKSAIAHSIKDTTLFLFQKNVDLFIKKLDASLQDD